MQTKIRKYQNILVCAGEGSIMFGLWAFIRVLIMFTMGQEKAEIIQSMKDDMSDTERILVWVIIVAVSTVFGLILFLFHLYIGLSAIREGHGTTKRRHVFLLISAFLFIANALSVLRYFFPSNAVTALQQGFWTTLAMFVMDMIGALMYFEIVFYSLRLRSLQKHLPKAADATEGVTDDPEGKQPLRRGR